MVQNNDKVKESVFDSEELIFNAPVETRMMGETLDEQDLAPRKPLRAMTWAEKRFHLLFYVTAALTGILLVQFIWQLAVFLAK